MERIDCQETLTDCQFGPDNCTAMIKTATAMRYVTPLREGSSLPAIVKADDGQLYVLKFSGAGQGPKALIAELVAGEIGRALGLRVPRMVFVELDPAFGRTEPDPEIRELLENSAGLNLGLEYLANAFAFNPLLEPPPDPDLASAVVWLDAYVTNVDRTPRNVNLLIWQRELWLIDHGACLYFHYNWNSYQDHARSPFPQIRDHALLPFASALDQADVESRARLAPDLIERVIDQIPDPWLGNEPQFASHSDHRQAYIYFLQHRLEASGAFVNEAKHARAQLL